MCLSTTSHELIQLTKDEQLVLAGLLRVLASEDGALNRAEVVAIEWIGGQIAYEAEALDDGSPYRMGAAVEPLGHVRLGELIARSIDEFPDESALGAAVDRVRTGEPRRFIYELLFELGAADTIQSAEWNLLDWLQERWELELD